MIKGLVNSTIKEWLSSILTLNTVGLQYQIIMRIGVNANHFTACFIQFYLANIMSSI